MGGDGACGGGGPSFFMELGALPDTPQSNPENILNPQTPVATPRNPEEHINWEAPTSCASLGSLLNWESAGSGFSLGSSVACPGPKRKTDGPPLHPAPPHTPHPTHPPTHVKKQHPGGAHHKHCGPCSKLLRHTRVECTSTRVECTYCTRAACHGTRVAWTHAPCHGGRDG